MIFDVTTRKGVISTADIDFKIEVIHPIFGNNLCEKLMNDTSKLRILKQQIGNVALIYKKSKERPLEALTKVFERTWCYNWVNLLHKIILLIYYYQDIVWRSSITNMNVDCDNFHEVRKMIS